MRGDYAVQCFFVISGFYTALILAETYPEGHWKQFYLNRFLRIYPAYWLVLGVTALGFAVNAGLGNVFRSFHSFQYWQHWRHLLSWKTALSMAISNLFLIGHDWTIFLKIDGSSGELHFTKWYLADEFQPRFLLALPQAWSLAIEVFFYLLAPLLAKRSMKTLFTVVVGSLVLRYWLDAQGLEPAPWSYRFFPSELAFFGAGMLSYRFYQFTHRKPAWERWASPLAKISLLGFLALCSLQASWVNRLSLNRPEGFLFFFCLVFAVPLFFWISKDSRMDRKIGELSYPVYLVHWGVISALNSFHFDERLRWGLAVGISLLSSWGLLFALEPVGRWRNRVRAQARGAEPRSTHVS